MVWGLVLGLRRTGGAPATLSWLSVPETMHLNSNTTSPIAQTGNRERHSAKLRKSSTIGDNSEDVMREMESQFLSFEALSDIYTDRLTKCYSRLHQILSELPIEPIPSTFCTDVSPVISVEKNLKSTRVRLTKALEFSKTAKPHVNAAPEDSGEGS
uniref:KxDL domain-containing protein n=1 Tax=Mesocestoides corti TaxID=53468 RepID=A0A5K3EX11_MESCO